MNGLEVTCVWTWCVIHLSWFQGIHGVTDFCSEPIGMQSRIIADAQLSASSNLKDREPRNARLHNDKPWCADGGDKTPYLQVTFEQVMGITKIAMQGDGTANNYVTEYKLSYSYDGTEYNDVTIADNHDSMKFLGNSDQSSTKVEDFKSFRVNAKYLKIVPSAHQGSSVCLRMELYGCPYACTAGLGFEDKETLPAGSSMTSSSEATGKEAGKARLKANTEWCASTLDANQYLQIDLGSTMTVAGIAVQGSSSSADWVKSFSVQFGDSLATLVTIQSAGSDKLFIGSSDQSTVAVTWFATSLQTQFLRIIPKEWNNRICMRIDVLGCQKDKVIPTGLERHVIQDNQFVASSNFDDREDRKAHHGRLNDFTTWCGKLRKSENVGKEWLAVDLGTPMVILGFSAQGDPYWGPNFLTEIMIEYSFDGSSWEFTKQENQVTDVKTFTGMQNNNGAQPTLLLDEAIVGRHFKVRAKKMNGEDNQCLRIELYGYPQHCSSSLGLRMGSAKPMDTTITVSSGTFSGDMGRLYYKEAWCAQSNDDAQYIQVEFGSSVMVSGVVLQGNPKADSWIKKFHVRYGYTAGSLSFIQQNGRDKLFSLIGDRDTAIYVWFPAPVEARIIRISPKEFSSAMCLRFDLMGCPNGCYQKLGLESGSVLDDDITSSSSYDSGTLPKYSRLNTLKEAWISCRSLSGTCSQGNKETAASKEWIQACFQSFVSISGLIVQGSGDLTIDRVQTFTLFYSYVKDGILYEYKRKSGLEVFSPKITRYGSKQIYFPVTLTTKCLRLQVESYFGSNAGIRWELLGCKVGGKPLVNLDSEFSVKRGENVSLPCRASGQPGVNFQWYNDTKEIFSGGAYSLSSSLSDGSLNRTSTSTLTISAAYPQHIGATQGNCSLYERDRGFFICAIRLKCTSSYESSSAKEEKTATLNIKELKGKATTPRLLNFTAITASEVTVKWNAPNDAGDFSFKHYKVRLLQSDQEKAIAYIQETEYKFSSLAPYTPYKVEVAYINVKDFSSDAVSEDFRSDQAAPPAPSSVTASERGPFNIDVTWEAPTPSNGVIHKYKIRYALNESSATKSEVDNISPEQGNVTIGRLNPFTVYFIEIQAFTKGGQLEGAWSTPVKVKTGQGKPSMPQQITIISNKEAIQVELEWKSPAILNGILSHYKIKIRGSKSYNESFSHLLEMTSGNKSAKLDTFGGTFYTVELSAVTGGGEGEATSTTFTTPIGVPSSPVIKVSETEAGKNINLYPASDLNGPISRHELVVLGAAKNCTDELRSLPPPAGMSTEIYGLKSLRTIQVKLGEELLQGVNLSLPLIGNYTLCCRAVASEQNVIKYGLPTSFNLERRSVKKLPPVPQSGVTATSFQVSLSEVQRPGVQFYHVCVMRLNKQVLLPNPSNFPPSSLFPYNASTQGTTRPYIAAEFSAQDFGKLVNFLVGDGKTYSRFRRLRRATEGSSEYFNAPLDKGATYTVFQRVFESPAVYYTSPWIDPVSTLSVKAVGSGEKGDGLGVALGTSIPIVLIAVIGVLIFLAIRRTRQKRPPSAPQPTQKLFNMANVQRSSEKALVTGIENPVEVTEDEATENDSPFEEAFSTDFPSIPPPNQVIIDSRFPPISIQAFAKYSEHKKRDSHYALSEEYTALNGGQQYPWEFAVSPQNKPKNRFANIAAYDHSRVTLKPISEDPSSDYVNANFIKDYEGKPAYIASQGPIPSTTADFWRMIWEYNVPAIIMLTNLIERGKRKCEQYWPNEGSDVYGEITVHFISEETYANYSIRKFSVKTSREKKSRQLSHYHFISWPDHGVPEQPTDLLNLRRRFRNTFPSEISPGPVAVHCSAGVGRTGTFIAIDAMIELSKRKKIIDIFNYINFIRSQRIHMVQTEEQYLFVYDAVLEAVTCGITEISAQNARVERNKLSSVNAQGKTGYEMQFERLSLVSDGIYEAESRAGRKKSSEGKNRRDSVIPKDSCRVVLQQSLYENADNDYINATFVNGYKRKDAFIATQYPLQSTVDDFWLMVYQRECGTIVILNQMTEGAETYPPIWPTADKELLTEQLTVTIQSEERNGAICRRTMTVALQGSQAVKQCDMLHLMDWPEEGIPQNTDGVLMLLREVERSQQQHNNSAPTIVLCSDGTGRTGTFIALMMLLDRFKVESLFDVFQTIKKIRFFRPQFVANVEQYVFCHDVILAYIDSFSDYGNFL